MLNHTRIQLETGCFQTIPGTWMTGIKNRHIILLCDSIDSIKQRQKVLLCVNIFLSMGGEQNIFSLLKTKSCMYI